MRTHAHLLIRNRVLITARYHNAIIPGLMRVDIIINNIYQIYQYEARTWAARGNIVLSGKTIFPHYYCYRQYIDRNVNWLRDPRECDFALLRLIRTRYWWLPTILLRSDPMSALCVHRYLRYIFRKSGYVSSMMRKDYERKRKRGRREGRARERGRAKYEERSFRKLLSSVSPEGILKPRLLQIKLSSNIYGYGPFVVPRFEYVVTRRRLPRRHESDARGRKTPRRCTLLAPSRARRTRPLNFNKS